MRARRYVWMAVALLLSFTAVGGGCTRSAQEDAHQKPIVVASKIDTEGALLGQMIIAMLQAHGYQVVDRTEFGPTEMVRRALLSGEIDIYPEYTGNGSIFFPQVDAATWKDAAAGLTAVRGLDADANGIVWLDAAPANNTWAIAVRSDLAQEAGLRTMEDLARYVSGGGRVKLACSEEFVTSPAALPAFQQAYGFTLRGDQLLTLSGGNTAQTEKAAAEGTDGVNMAMAYGTDGSLAALGLTVLEDPLGAQPVFQPAPTVRRQVLEQYPDLPAILNPVFRSLDLVTLQRLNARVAVEGEQAAAVARDYLRQQGFLQP